MLPGAVSSGIKRAGALVLKEQDYREGERNDEEVLGLARGAACSRCCGRRTARAGRRRQDRRAVSADRQRRRGGPGLQGRGRSRRRDHQRQASGACRHPARRGRGPARTGRRQARAGLRRPSGQSVGRAAAGAAAGQPGQGQRPVRRLSVVLLADGDRGWRTLRHPVRGRRFGRGQHHRPRLQMGLSRHADRERLCRGLYALLRRHEEGGQDRQLDRDRQREHRLRHLGCRRGGCGGQEGRHHGRDPGALQRERDRCRAAGAAAQGEEPGRGDLHQLHLRLHPLHEDDDAISTTCRRW